tara:strand:+ start:462 stop:743 length:282 start_codon:yes stop_codon:yes gene_type:complete
MVDQTRWGISDVISQNKGRRYEMKKKKSEKFLDRRVKAMTKISKKRGWDFSDANPFFDDVYLIMPHSKATNSREYKQERKKYEKNNNINVPTN